MALPLPKKRIMARNAVRQHNSRDGGLPMRITRRFSEDFFCHFKIVLILA